MHPLLYAIPLIAVRAYTASPGNDAKGDFLNIEQTWRFKVTAMGTDTNNGGPHIELVRYRFNIYPATGRVKFHTSGYTIESTKAVTPFVDSRQTTELKKVVGREFRVKADSAKRGRPTCFRRFWPESRGLSPLCPPRHSPKYDALNFFQICRILRLAAVQLHFRTPAAGMKLELYLFELALEHEDRGQWGPARGAIRNATPPKMWCSPWPRWPAVIAATKWPASNSRTYQFVLSIRRSGCNPGANVSERGSQTTCPPFGKRKRENSLLQKAPQSPQRA